MNSEIIHRFIISSEGLKFLEGLFKELSTLMNPDNFDELKEQFYLRFHSLSQSALDEIIGLIIDLSNRLVKLHIFEDILDRLKDFYKAEFRYEDNHLTDRYYYPLNYSCSRKGLRKMERWRLTHLVNEYAEKEINYYNPVREYLKVSDEITHLGQLKEVLEQIGKESNQILSPEEVEDTFFLIGYLQEEISYDEIIADGFNREVKIKRSVKASRERARLERI